MSRTEEILARLAASTGGPWERGDSYLEAAVMPEFYGHDRCGLCGPDAPLIWQGDQEIDGDVVTYHAHRSSAPRDPEHVIVGFADDGAPVTVCGNYDYDSGGVVDPNDTEFLVNARDDIEWLLVRNEHLREALTRALRTVGREDPVLEDLLVQLDND